jgi:hypothetical protein
MNVRPGPKNLTGRAFQALAQLLLTEDTMMPQRLALALALLPCMTFAPGCDTAGKKVSTGDDIADSEGSEDSDSTDGTDSDSTDGTTEDPTVGTGTDSTTDSTTDDGDTSSTGEPPPPPPPPVDYPDGVVPCDAENGWMGEACTAEGGLEGTSFCIVVDGAEVQTPCYTEPPCSPGDSFDQGCMGYVCAWDGTDLYPFDWSEPGCETPLVVDFEGGPLQFDAVGAASFDLMGASECAATDWPTLPWLALDRDGDGAISDGRELFGSGTLMATGLRATHGFQALAELDANRDGKLTPADPAFADLVLWSDRDDNRHGELAELLPIREANLVAIDLAYSSRIECDDRGNCGRERARFEFRAPTGEVRSGEIVDVYLACQ